MYSQSSFPAAQADQLSNIDPALQDAEPPKSVSNGENLKTGTSPPSKLTTVDGNQVGAYAAQPPASEPSSKPAKTSKARTMSDLTLTSTKTTATKSPAPKPQITLDDDMRSEIRYFYMQEYGYGIDAFLDTDWYVNAGIDVLEKDEKVTTSFAEMLTLFQTTKGEDYEAMRLLPGTEGRLVWSLMCLPRSFSGPALAPRLKDVQAKLVIVEHLMTGQIAQNNPFTGSESDEPQQDPSAKAFWRALATYVSSSQQSETPNAKTSLEVMRGNLAEKENRDALYSMAVMRDILQKHPSALAPSHSITATTSIVGLSDDEQLAFRVAKKFLEDEAAGKGTTQAIQRLCGMAIRGWAMMGK